MVYRPVRDRRRSGHSAVRDGVVARPGRFGLLRGAGRVTVVPARRREAGRRSSRVHEPARRAWRSSGWVPVQGEERDPQQFWLWVLGALRGTAAGSKLVRL